MHISDGALKVILWGPDWLMAGGGVLWGMTKVRVERLPHVAVLAAAFFVASLIHLKIGPTSVHPVLSGLIGALLGWVAVPAIFVGLTLQFLLFSHGGLTTLGINTFNMAGPAVLSYYLFRPWMFKHKRSVSAIGSFLCGAVPVLISTCLIYLELVLAEDQFLRAAQVQALAHIPVALAEGVLTAFVVIFLRRVGSPLLEE